MKITLDTEKKTVTLLEDTNIAEVSQFISNNYPDWLEWRIIPKEDPYPFYHFWYPHYAPQYIQYPGYDYNTDINKEYYTLPPITCENKADERDQALKNPEMTLEEMKTMVRDTPITFGSYSTGNDPMTYTFPKDILWDKDKIMEELANQEGKCWAILTKENVDNLLKEYRINPIDKNWLNNEELRLAKEMSKDDPIDTDAMHYKEKFPDPNAIKANLVRMRRRKIIKPKK